VIEKVVCRMKKVVFPRISELLAAVITVVILPEAQSALPGVQPALPVVPPPLYSIPVTLAWNPADDAAVSGYAVYYGPTNQPATNRIDAGLNSTVTLFDLHANVGYKVYAVSYNAAGVESLPSNDLLLTLPALSRLQLARQADGSMQLSGKAAPRTVCTVLFAPTPQPAFWQPLTQTRADAVGNLIALDISAHQVKSRFYRVVLGTQPLLGEMRIQRLPDGNMVLSGKAPPGASCRVLYASTPNAPDWKALKNITADPEGNVSAIDTPSGVLTCRFYRMAMP
jgi:hypothetical protein